MKPDSKYISFLKRIELFKNLTDNELQIILPRIERKRYKTNSMVFRENTSRKNVFIIYTGEVELYKTSSHGTENRLAVFGPTDFLGEGALMDDYPHATSARARSAAVILCISRNVIEDLLRENPQISEKILSAVSRVISRRMRQASTRVVNVAAQYISGRTRTEHDLLGDREVPYEYYYGIQTLRALENFNISGISLTQFPLLIEAHATVKMAATRANLRLGLLPQNLADAMMQACQEIINGKLHTQFVVDMIQGGAGTSTNMNANEVIANRTLELLGYEKGQYEHCHPNNHVNLSQSTNDVYPTALKLALIRSNDQVIRVLKELISAFRQKVPEFSAVIKMGRTQLQDAVPMTLGQEFEAYAVTLEEEVERLNQNVQLFLEVNLGGTAIGTGINAPAGYAQVAIDELQSISGIPVRLADNLVEATQDTGAFVMYSSALKRLAIKLSKICNDLRLLSSGPRAGLNEINLPKMQPGSSIMPGKVNPVIPEVVNQIAFKVIGNDLTVTLAAEAGQLELNVMEPIIAESLFESIEILKNGMITLNHRCIQGITANPIDCRRMVENSIGIITALNPRLGYDVCSKLAQEALKTGRGVYELVVEKKLLSRKELDKLLDPVDMAQPK
jgi:aspartate ammonia-lyase